MAGLADQQGVRIGTPPELVTTPLEKRVAALERALAAVSGGGAVNGLSVNGIPTFDLSQASDSTPCLEVIPYTVFDSKVDVSSNFSCLGETVVADLHVMCEDGYYRKIRPVYFQGHWRWEIYTGGGWVGVYGYGY